MPHCKQLTVLVVAAYFPGSHEVHTVAPTNEAYVPETQPTQFVEFADPAMDENFPAVQYSQMVKLDVLEYLPVLHD